MFLGWTEGKLAGHHYFVRQLRDIKISMRVDLGFREMDLCATWCGRALALAHSRSGSSTMLSGYLGKSATFDRALAEFSVAYADQNERDHPALEKAVRSGKVKAVFEELKLAVRNESRTARRLAQNVIAPEICSVYPWKVDLHSNSRKYLMPRLTFRSGRIALVANPRPLTL